MELSFLDRIGFAVKKSDSDISALVCNESLKKAQNQSAERPAPVR